MVVQQEQISILYLDDEEHNLSAFKAGFRRTHKVRVALNAQEAFRQLEEELPHVIIADQRMPGMSGVEFFERVKSKYPIPARILLTAYSGSQTVIDAVNRGNIDKYMLKPWDIGIMESTLKAGYSMYRAKNELRERNAALLRVNEELNRLIYSVSHDLRAPLISVMGLIDLSLQETDREEVNTYLGLMKSGVDKMDEHIHTTLEYYRNFKTDLSPSQVDILDLTKNLISGLENYSRHLHFELNASEEHVVYTDRTRVKIALSNVLSNAVKYGRKKVDESYTIQVDIEKFENGVRIHVRDRGVGIRRKDLESIFEIFNKSNGAYSDRSTGLGLYLVKEAVHKIGGTVSVESEFGHGSSFTLEFPDLDTLDSQNQIANTGN